VLVSVTADLLLRIRLTMLPSPLQAHRYTHILNLQTFPRPRHRLPSALVSLISIRTLQWTVHDLDFLIQAYLCVPVRMDCFALPI
jgi:hypothetical protein